MIKLETHSDYIHIEKRFMTDSWQIQKIFDKIFFCPQYFWNQISLIPKLWFFIFGPKICLRSQLWVTSIHVQNTFLTDSKQIQKIPIQKRFMTDSWQIKKMLGKIFFVPNIFGIKFLLYLSYDSKNIHAQKNIPDRFKTD